MEGRFFDKKVVYRNFCTIYLILWMLQAYCSCGWCDHGQKPIYNNWNWCYMYLWSAAGTGTFDEHQHRQVAYVTVIVQLSWRYGKLKLTGFYRVTMGITVSPWALPCHHGRYRVTMGVTVSPWASEGEQRKAFSPSWILKFDILVLPFQQKEVVFLVSKGINKLSPLLPLPYRKINLASSRKIHHCPPLKKILPTPTILPHPSLHSSK